MNSDHAHAIVPRFDDFVVDPFPVRCVRPDQDDCAGSSVHLIRDPSLDGSVTAFLYGFPIII